MLIWTLGVALAQDLPTAFVGGTVYPIASAPIPDGTVLVQGGRIVAVGPTGSVTLPPNVVRVDVSGHSVMPGLVDTHSHIGATGDLNESSGPLQPTLSAVDSIDATHPSLQLAQAGGLTTVNVMPGSGNLVGGQTAYLKLRDARTVDALLYCADRGAGICGGLKMANGTNPQGEGGYPRTRMGAAAQVRALFEGAREHAAVAPSDAKRRKEPPAEDVPLAQRALVEVLEGRRVVHFHTHRADDVATAIALGEEFGFTPVLHHVSEAWKVADLIAENKVPCSLILVDSPGGKEEAVEIRAESAGILEKLGVPVALHTDDPITDSRLFLRSAALAVGAGMTEAGALSAVTLTGARMLGLDARIGSLEAGKDADLIVLSGPPLSVYTHVEQTWVEGTRVFDRTNAVDLRYATGGYDVADRYPVSR